jgi:hypothetical protein
MSLVEKDPVDLERTIVLQVARAAIRLKHATEAVRELNHVLPAVERAFNALVLQGELPDAKTAKKAFDEVIYQEVENGA